MHERRRPLSGDITGPEHGDYTDWNNPEDDEEGAPEGYYVDPPEADARADEDDDSYIPGPDDPDYDLSEEAGYAGYEPPQRRTIMPRWVLVTISILLILAFLLPVLLQAR